MESVIDEISSQLGIDPIEFRLLNAAKQGTRRIEGPAAARIGLMECLEAARDHEHYKTPVGDGNRGRGIACGYWMNRSFQSSLSMTVNYDGTITLIMGSVDIGGSRASIAQQTAEVLGIAYEDIKPTVVDTDSIGYTFITGGSRTSFATGWAAIEAGEDVKAQMIARAARIWDTEADNVEYVDGVIQHTSDPELHMTFKELARQLGSTGGAITGASNVEPTERATVTQSMWWIWKSTRIPVKWRFSATPQFKTLVRRSIPAMSKARCRAGWSRGSDGP